MNNAKQKGRKGEKIVRACCFASILTEHAVLFAVSRQAIHRAHTKDEQLSLFAGSHYFKYTVQKKKTIK